MSEEYRKGWMDGMKTAYTLPEGKSGYGRFRSANGVKGAGPDAVIVDGDWLMARLNELSEFTGKDYT